MHKIVLSSLTVLLLSGAIHGQELTLDQRTLRGLKGFHVIIEKTNNSSAETTGLTKNQLQTDVELRLRKAGVRVLTEKEWLLSSRTPALYVNLNILTLDRIAERYYAYSLNVEVKQLVYLQTSPPVETLASTWDKGLAGAAGRDSLDEVRRGLGDLLDYLINDYLAANPRLQKTRHEANSHDGVSQGSKAWLASWTASFIAATVMLPFHSSIIVSESIPFPTRSSTSDTKTLVPRNVGLPWQIFGSVTM